MKPFTAMTEEQIVAIEARWDAAAVRGWSTDQALFAASVGAPVDIWLLLAEVRRLRTAMLTETVATSLWDVQVEP